MKLTDLLNFLIPSAALLLLDPSAGNMFQLSVEQVLKDTLGVTSPHWPFWLLLLAYWGLLMVWVRMAHVHPTRELFDDLCTRARLGGRFSLECNGLKEVIWFLIGWGRLLTLLPSLSALGAAFRGQTALA